MRILTYRPGRPGPGGFPGAGTAAGSGGTTTDRWIGMWSARVLCAIGVAYAVIMVAGFAAMGPSASHWKTPTGPSWRS
ncbi:MAG TPA: hypothetical protein VEF71_02410 [Streptosporangiaceae bacterium]|nr:hypothetical protein [Streptosporangiaceae bacterium]